MNRIYCPICGNDMGRFTDSCDPCWQLRNGLVFLDNCKVGKEEALKRLGLKEVEKTKKEQSNVKKEN